jgi:hypothetical protein
MPAVVVAGAIAAAGAVGAAAISSSAQKKASQQATQAAQHATDQNIALQQQVREENKGILSPYVQTGNQATGALNSLLYGNDNGASLSALQASPGYQFRMDQGSRALNTGWAARGMLNSGAAQKAALKYGQDYASNEYGNRFNQLAQQQGVGLSAGNALAGVGTNFANSASNQNNSLATVQANAALASGQSTANVYGTAANALGQIGGSFISSYKPPQAQSWYGGVGGTVANLGYR